MPNNCGCIAVIDDDSDILDSFRLLLDLEGIAARLYHSAAEFLAEADRRCILCMILDQHMPRMTGLELAERLRRNGEKIPILLVTGAPMPAIVDRATQLGIEGVLEKPPSEDELLRFARRYVVQPSGLH